MSEWKKVRLGDVGQIITGKTPLTKVPSYYDGLIHFVSPADLNGCDKNILNTAKTISNSGLQSIKGCILPKGTICVSCIGNLGYVGITSMECASNQQINSIIVDESRFDLDFIYYVIKHLWRYFKSQENQSTTISIINKSTFSNIEIYAPSLEIQKKIASILSSLDDKIAVNRRICENLEAQAQALFKHWFIDFAPFKNGKFVESELGMIPEGLIYKRIEEMPHTLETGKRPAGGVKGIESGVPSIGAENIKGLGCYDYSKTKYITEEYAASMKKGKINGYELLIYKDGGKPGYFIPNFAIFGEGYPYDEMCLNEHVFKLDFGNKGYSLFAYFFFKTKQIMSYLNAQGAKAAIPGINSKDIDSIMMPSLDNEKVKEYCNEVEDVITLILKLSKESSRLSTLRDTLLPKLMSGQIKVNEIESI